MIDIQLSLKKQNYKTKKHVQSSHQQQQMLVFLVASCSSLPLNVNGKNFMVVGSPSAASFIFDATASPIWTVLFSSFGTETMTGLVGAGLTVDASGMWMVYQATNGSAVTKLSTTATALPSITTANLNFAALTAKYTAGLVFDLTVANKVFKMCVYNGMGLTNMSTGITPSCGSYHTFTSIMSSSALDRNMGVISTNWTGTGVNNYTLNLYGSLYNSSTNVKLVNYALVITSNGSAPFEIWSAIGVTNKMMINQDMVLQSKNGSVYDGWSTSRSASTVSQDSAISCKNDVSSISYGKSTTSGKQYIYWHGSRQLATGDSSCDLDISSETPLCTIFQEGTTVTDFALTGPHSTVVCGSLVLYLHMMHAGVLILAVASLI